MEDRTGEEDSLEGPSGGLSALSCKSVRSLSPPGGMVAYVKAGYTPRDEWTLFRAFLLLTLWSRFCTLTCRCLCTRGRGGQARPRMREYSAAYPRHAVRGTRARSPLLPPPLRNLFLYPPSLLLPARGIDNPLLFAERLVARVLACPPTRIRPTFSEDRTSFSPRRGHRVAPYTLESTSPAN